MRTDSAENGNADFTPAEDNGQFDGVLERDSGVEEGLSYEANAGSNLQVLLPGQKGPNNNEGAIEEPEQARMSSKKRKRFEKFLVSFEL